MSKTFIIRVPKSKNRNPLAMTGGERGRSQTFQDRRMKRSKDARAKREAFGFED